MTNDISNFMSWFIGQVVSMFGSIFNILDSITFSGTSLLKFILVIVILSALLPVVLTLSQSVNTFTSISEKRQRNSERSKHNKNERSDS